MGVAENECLWLCEHGAMTDDIKWVFFSFTAVTPRTLGQQCHGEIVEE